MSVVYPVHLQREIDRRWLQRSEESASGRMRLEVLDLLREAAVTPQDRNAAGPPCATAVFAM
jgi:hypothetical protein